MSNCLKLFNSNFANLSTKYFLMINTENQILKKIKMSEPDDYSLKNSYELISVNSHSVQNNICINYNNLPFAESVEQFFEDPSHFKPKPEFLSILFNENDDTILTHVVKMQNTDAVLALIKTGVDVNTPNRKGITPISAAAHKGNVSIMESLIRAGAHVNALNSSGSTALIQVLFNIS